MNRRRLLMISFLATTALAMPALASASYRPHNVDVDVVGTNGRPFPVFPTDSDARNVYRAYLEARNQERYRIRVRNRGGERVGLVIAVDGRNIISGARSDLERNERMYILGPWESAEYEGWRTGSDRVNEFYFTDWQGSYAEAFGDRSARGVIAVAVYRERDYEKLLRKRQEEAEAQRDARAADKSEPAPSSAPATREENAGVHSQQPGTGYGSEVYSPSRLVDFDPERNASSRYFFKYEWRDSLCGRGVIDCGEREPNRFWDERDRYGFAPPPPGKGRH
jgi:hypothetical protein